MSCAGNNPMSLLGRLMRGHNERIAAHFESLAGNYLQHKNRNRYYNQYLIRWCRSFIAPGKKVLDVGCGRGDVLAAMQPAEGLGIDLSESMVKLAAAEM